MVKIKKSLKMKAISLELNFLIFKLKITFERGA